jgi:hypothetical protein
LAKQEVRDIPPERSAPWHSAQELLPSLAMKFSVAVLPCDPPVGRTNHPGTDVPGEVTWATVPPPAPPEAVEVLAVEHPAPATARSSSNPTGVRRARREPFPKKYMFPPVRFPGAMNIGFFPHSWVIQLTIIILRARFGERRTISGDSLNIN